MMPSLTGKKEVAEIVPVPPAAVRKVEPSADSSTSAAGSTGARARV